MEKIVVFVERIMADKTRAMIIGIIAMIAPIYFLKTLYVVWFGSPEIFLGFKAESSTWLVLATVDGVGFFTTLPARKKGRIMQIVMGAWTIEMCLVFLATLVR